MVIIMLAGVMFPLWPVKLRIGVWYLSILALGLLGALIVLAIVRLIFWCITVVVSKKAIWMFPNLFEDVGFVSHFFCPFYSIRVGKVKEKAWYLVHDLNHTSTYHTITCSKQLTTIVANIPL